MYLQKSKNQAGKVFLSFVEGYRKDGKVKHRTIEKLGYLEDLEKEYDDPIAHFKKIAKERTEEQNAVPKKLEVDLLERLSDNTSNRKNLGYAVIKACYEELGLYNFLKYKQRTSKCEFNLNNIFNFLVINRFLFPSSILEAYNNKDRYFESNNFSIDDCYRSLDLFASYSEDIQALLAKKTNEMYERDKSLGYWDVTNYYFEIPYEDDDEYDNDGNLKKKGFRKRGPSKEHKKDPIVQMGLLMDSNGIPMGFNLFSGGESEKTNMLPAIRRAKRKNDINRIIVVADRGLNSSDNTTLLSGINNDDTRNNDGYIYGQSIAGSDGKFKEWVLNQDDYITDIIEDEKEAKEEGIKGNKIIFKHKSRIEAKTVTLKDRYGKRRLTTVIYQKQMVYYSEKYAAKQRKDREKTLEKSRRLIANPGQYTQATSYGATAYIKNIKYDKKTGEVLNGSELILDQKKIDEESKYDGYYAIVTSEKNMSDLDIRNKYKGLWEIEESFKIIKSEFKGRPIFVRTFEHIHAHFLICYVALVIMRIIEHKVDSKYTTKAIRNALRNYCCSYLDKNYYLFDYHNEVIDEFSNIFNWDLSQKYMPLEKIKNILKHREEFKIKQQ